MAEQVEISDDVLARYRRAAESSGTYTWFNYQPINLPGFEETLKLAGRDCFDRSGAIVRQLQSFFGIRRLRIIDWGCNLGFFCFELAKAGHDVVGIDRNAEMIDVCRRLAESNEFPVRPRFHCQEMSPESIAQYWGFNAALCFSVLHHLGGQKMKTLKAFSEAYPVAFVEMDGPGLGYNHLFPFYQDLLGVVETNDPYGRGHRRRKTWFCSNETGPHRYQNIKPHNLLAGRGVFRRTDRISGESTVMKRELVD